MALTDTDRRRFFLATTLTLLALPALWWANQSENSAAPNVAVAGAGVGVDVGAAHDDSTATAAASTATGDTIADTAGAPVVVAVASDEPTADEIAPVFLDGPSGAVGAGVPEIAVPARPEVARVEATATFRSSIGNASCAVPGLINGRTVTVVNLDNSRSITCVTVVAPGALRDQITLSTSQFSELADLTDAPIPVEIRQ